MKQLFFQKPFKYSFQRATIGIVALNVLIFILQFVTPGIYRYIYAYGALSVGGFFGNHMFWQVLSYMFLHQNPSHLFFNMFGLLIFGLNLERAIGSKEFVLMYILCGVFSGIFSVVVYLFTGQYYVFLLGASGAIYAILFAYAVVYPRSVIYIWGILPLPAPLMVGIYALIEIGSQFLGRGANVAHMTHLFGFFAAFLYFIIRMRINPFKVWKNEYRK